MGALSCAACVERAVVWPTNNPLFCLSCRPTAGSPLGEWEDRFRAIEAEDAARLEDAARAEQSRQQREAAVWRYVAENLPSERMDEAERASYAATLADEFRARLRGDDAPDVWGPGGRSVPGFRTDWEGLVSDLAAAEEAPPYDPDDDGARHRTIDRKTAELRTTLGRRSLPELRSRIEVCLRDSQASRFRAEGQEPVDLGLGTWASSPSGRRQDLAGDENDRGDRGGKDADSSAPTLSNTPAAGDEPAASDAFAEQGMDVGHPGALAPPLVLRRDAPPRWVVMGPDEFRRKLTWALGAIPANEKMTRTKVAKAIGIDRTTLNNYLQLYTVDWEQAKVDRLARLTRM